MDPLVCRSNKHCAAYPYSRTSTYNQSKWWAELKSPVDTRAESLYRQTTRKKLGAKYEKELTYGEAQEIWAIVSNTPVLPNTYYAILLAELSSLSAEHLNTPSEWNCKYSKPQHVAQGQPQSMLPIAWTCDLGVIGLTLSTLLKRNVGVEAPMHIG